MRSRASRPPPYHTLRRGPVIGAGEADGVADDHVGPALGVAGAAADALVAEPLDELALVAAGGRAGADDPLERLPARALGVLAALAELPAAPTVGGELAVLEPAAAASPRAGLEAPQPEPLLELPARLLGAWPVVVDAGLAAVLGHERDDQVRVVGAAGGAAVADRDPPALRPRALAGEAHLLDELLGRSPPTARPRSSGSCGCSDSEQCHTCASRAPIRRPFLSRSAIVTRVPNASRGSSRNRASATASERSSSLALRHPDRLGRAGDQVRVLVLLALALPDQVEQHAVRLAAAGDVRDHRRTPVSCRSSRDELVDLGERLLEPPALAAPARRCSPSGRAG